MQGSNDNSNCKLYTQNKHENVCELRNRMRTKMMETKKIMNLFAFLYALLGNMTGCEVSALKTFLASRLTTHMQKSDAVNNFRSIRRGTEKVEYSKIYCKLVHCDSLMFICGRFLECACVCESEVGKMWNTLFIIYYFWMHHDNHLWHFVYTHLQRLAYAVDDY